MKSHRGTQMDKTWKKFERWVASFLTEIGDESARVPVSGRSRGDSPDVTSDVLSIECKYRKKHAVIKLWNETNEMAKKEKKTPVVALCEHGKPGFWVMMHSADLKNIATYICKLLEDNDDSKYPEKK